MNGVQTRLQRLSSWGGLALCPLILGARVAAHAAELDGAEADDFIDVGLRLGASAVVPAEGLTTLASAYAVARFRADRFFLQLAPGFFVPADPTADHAYGGLGLELGGGWFPTDRVYLGGGVASRLQFGEYNGPVGVAPYAHLGVLTGPIGPARMFAEVRAYQNVLPVLTGSEVWLPLEIGVATGVTF